MKSFIFALTALAILLCMIPAGCGKNNAETEQGIFDQNGTGGGGNGSGNDKDPAVCGAELTEDAVLNSDLYCGYFGEEAAIRIAADGVTLDCKGHSIIILEGSAIPGIEAKNVDRVAIRNCTVEQAVIGIHFLDVRSADITGNRILESGHFGIFGDNLDGFSIDSNRVQNTENLINCIEIFNSESGSIDGNEVSGCGSGINLYGSREISIAANSAHDIGDTGLGFFDSDGVVTHDIEATGNEVYNCGNIGAVEIMWGSHHLTFTENDFHDNRSGAQVYDARPGPMHDLVFADNRIRNNPIGIHILDLTETLVVTGNEFVANEIALSLTGASDVSISENTFRMEEGKKADKTMVLQATQVENFAFNHNVILEYEFFLEFSGGNVFDFSENHWDGCPDLSRFQYGDNTSQSIAALINPINPLPCFYNSNPMDIIDEDGNGEDDFDCEREETNECMKQQR